MLTTSPLTPPNCDLRSFDWFPFYHKRLLQSSFWSRASDKACRISVDFWSKAYEQVPAASLPDDDFLLAEWAGFGRRNVEAWLAVKAEVMEPWKHCTDGRWYHPTLSEVACKAWVERRLLQWKWECERVRKANLRRKEKGLELLQLPQKPSDDPFEDGDAGQASCGQKESSAGQIEVSAGHPPESFICPQYVLRKSDGKSPHDAGIPAENTLKEKERETTPSGKYSELRSDDLPTNEIDPGRKPPDPDDPVQAMFALGKRLWGAKSGGSLVGKLRKAVGNDGEAAGLMRDIAHDMGPDDGKSYLMGIVRSRDRSSELTLRDRGEAW